MKWYGSLDNRLMEAQTEPEEIKVGMGATEFYWSDRHPYEVTKVIDNKHIYIRRMNHVHEGDGVMDNNWRLEPDETRPEEYIVKRGKKWYSTATVTREDVEDYDNWELDKELWLCHWGFGLDVIREKGKQTKYSARNIRVGYADYYFDYEY